jgi:hypothetical protein
MPFNTLVLTCLVPETSLSEAGSNVSLQRKAGETVLFFHIDEKSNPRSTFRQDLKIEGRLCDGLVLYRKADNLTLCLIELKGGDVEGACEQITNTHRCLRQALSTTMRDKKDGNQAVASVIWKAYIHLHGAAPRDTKRCRGELERLLGRNRCEISHKSDLSPFLRQ